MTSNHPLEMDSGTVDSVTSTPRSDHHPSSTQRLHDDLQPRVRFMCSFGGQILPRPHDNQLRYVGGDTRIVAVNRSTSFSSLLSKLSKLSSGTPEITVKYQLPNEDLDSLISVSTDEDVENMMDEYDRLIQGSNNPKLARLRLFLFPIGNSRSSSIGSLLDGSTKRESWFLDALNGGGVGSASLERVRSEASSIISEVPDYLFGLDTTTANNNNNSSELGETRESKLLRTSRPVLTDNVPGSDPGSPAPPTSSSPYYSTSSSIPNLPPVKTRPTNPIATVDSKEEPIRDHPTMIQQQTAGYAATAAGNPVWHYLPETHFPAPSVQQMPVYYMPPGSVHHQVHQPVHHMPPPTQYVQRFQAPVGQIPVSYRHQVPAGVGQIYGGGGGGGGMKPVTHMEAAAAYEYEYSTPTGVVNNSEQHGGVPQATMYYGTRNSPMLPTYAAAAAATMVQGGIDQMQGGKGTEMKMGNNKDINS